MGCFRGAIFLPKLNLPEACNLGAMDGFTNFQAAAKFKLEMERFCANFIFIWIVIL